MGEIYVGTSNVSSKSHVKNLDANDFERESLSKESDEAGISFSGGNSMKDTISLQQENVAVHSVPIKRPKLHWGYKLSFKLGLISDMNVNITSW